jgi:tRNA1(Val) A37 N6-methylase TrmN6
MNISKTELTSYMKRFYERFKTEHGIFKSFITGIDDNADYEWYTSLMLNRLMFIYFIQKKGFLDNDIHYLKNRLQAIQSLKGKDQFHQTFYRYFLLRLFHDGLGKRERNKELEKLIGKIPYLNGGFFEVHKIEFRYKNIDIRDEAFEKLFSFFDEFEWHLDTRHHVTGKEINPDVLCHIFEKYINQKEKGAYYTKEDITEYISKSTIIPFLFDKSGIDENHPVWELLKNDPNRYIYNAVKKGVDETLPATISAGIDDVSKRTDWNKVADEKVALPTETWREHVARRLRCHDIRDKMKLGQIKSVNDLITFNLDIRQLAQDMIVNTDDPTFLQQFYSALDSVTVLDPTCGSGAFLFAAMNILKPLYEACLDRMENMLNRTAKSTEVLRKIKTHPNRQYFICKNIILNNLYGVDIMDEAVESCKLRLFLKLVAKVESADKIEPLPDIDFNIRAGNTLVGYVSMEQIKQSQQGKFQLDDDIKKIETSAKHTSDLFKKFQQVQTDNDEQMDKFNLGLKEDLRKRLDQMRLQLDEYLAEEYEIDISKNKEEFEQWQKSHQPFHWIVEFYGILHNGGFDVVIGNPPYLEYSKVRGNYQIKGYETIRCGNLYAFVIEMSLQILHNNNNLGMIIPLTFIANNNMADLRKFLTDKGNFYCSSYEIRPSALFEGVEQRLTIFILRQKIESLFSTSIQRWSSKQRSHLFSLLHYAKTFYNNTISRFSTEIENRIYTKLMKHKTIANYISNLKSTKNHLHYRTAGIRYWIIFLNEGFNSESLSNKTVSISDNYSSKEIMAVLNSNLFWWYYSTHYDMFNLTDYMIFSFRYDIQNDNQLIVLSEELEKDLNNNKQLLITNSRTRGSVESFVFLKKKSKSLIDAIDRILAQHYGFTDEELDFIINYDIKYR